MWRERERREESGAGAEKEAKTKKRVICLVKLLNKIFCYFHI